MRTSQVVWRVLAVLLVVAVALLLRARAVHLLPVDYDEDDYLRAAQQQAIAIQAGDWGELTELNYRSEHPPLAMAVSGMMQQGGVIAWSSLAALAIMMSAPVVLLLVLLQRTLLNRLVIGGVEGGG